MRILASFLLVGLLAPVAAPILCANARALSVASCEAQPGPEDAWQLEPAEGPCDGCGEASCEDMLACTTTLSAAVEKPIQTSAYPESLHGNAELARLTPNPSSPPPSPPPQL